MKFAAFHILHNWKVKYKIVLVFVVFFVLMADLGALNVTSMIDIQEDTKRISEKLIPRLIETTEIKDSLNLAILSAYDYVQTGNTNSKDQYETYLRNAIAAEYSLFINSTSEADLEFTTSFQTHINDINDSLHGLISAYETGESPSVVLEQLELVSENRDAFAQFLKAEIETAVQLESQHNLELTTKQVRQTAINVAVVAVIALSLLLALFLFIRRSITHPIQTLTAAARQIGKGNFVVVDVESKDELGLFAETFNSMTQNIRATQEALQIELEKTKKLDKQKTEFLSIAAHQLRTPMAGIKWLVNMVVEGDLGKVSTEAKDQLGKGMENINRMIALINSLLDVTQIEAQQFQYQLESVDIVEAAQSVAASLEHNASAGALTLIVTPPANALPPVITDRVKFDMALRNIVDNAIKYTPKKGSVTITFGQKGQEIYVAVADTGYGIPQDEADRVFTKFYRGTNIQAIQADGSGLGLFVVKQIIDQLGGEISFESEVDKGTTFTILLPVATEAALQKAEQARAEVAAHADATKKNYKNTLGS